MSRRGVLQLLGASAALAGASGCSRGNDVALIPYVDQAPEITPSAATQYATTMTLAGYAIGMIVDSHVGRPTKVEGNPRHPASAGALGAIEQAAVASFYDPGRASSVRRRGAPATWAAFVEAIAARPPPGKRIHLVLEPTSAPHVADLVDRVRARGDVVVHFDAPVDRAAAWQGARRAFGRVLEPRYDFARAARVLALDCDFLNAAATPASWAGAWAKGRRVEGPADAMSRLYVAEARLSVTGMAADERLRIRSRDVAALAAALLADILRARPGAPAPASAIAASIRDRRDDGTVPRGWVEAVGRDLRAHPGTSVVLAGDGQPAAVHTLVHAMNELLANAGATVTYGPSPIAEAGGDSHGLDGLVRALDAGEVSALVFVGGNPVYSAAADRELAARLARLPPAVTTAYVGLRPDNETARACEWFVPEAHFLESWGDARAFDGTASLVQPLMNPSPTVKTAGQILASLIGLADASSRDLVDAYWRGQITDGFAAFRDGALVRGVIGPGTPPIDPPPRVDWQAVAAELDAARPVGPAPAAAGSPAAAVEIVFFPDAKIYDGRFADNAWLQELADPVTKLTWDNAALLGPATAARAGIASGDVVELEVRGRRLRAPALVVPGMADDAVAIALGYGQTGADRVASGAGADAYRLRDSRAPWFDTATIRRTGDRYRLALTQEHWSLEGRPIVLRKTIEEYRADPDFARPQDAPVRHLYELRPTAEHQWGMMIDLNACTGCSACVVACMAENNIPVVGKTEVALSREMHWLRIDRYFVGDERAPAVVVQPMLCQHCEHAPCEYVCPVNATVHSPDGLNEMVYNRCVGTRFCSNNCPYKVRRFNYFNYHPNDAEGAQLAENPDVTVRARGVMEKCSYCVQRIRRAEIRTRRERTPLRDGDVVTACQQTCPTGAITFGDIADPSSRVAEQRRNPRAYQVLRELGTAPRTQYLARIVNPNPDLPRT